MKKQVFFLITVLSCTIVLNAQNQWIVYDTTNSGLQLPLSNRIQEITVENDSIIWIGTHDSPELIRYDGSNWTYLQPDSMPVCNITSISIDINGNKWVGLRAGWFSSCYGLFETDETAWIFYNPVGFCGFQSISSIVIDNNGVKWITGFTEEVGSVKGLVSFNGIEWIEYDTTNSIFTTFYFVNDIAVANNGTKWFVWSEGLASYDDVTWTTYDLSTLGIPNTDLKSIAVEENGIVWIGTYYNGIVSLNDTIWNVYNTSNSGLPTNNVQCISIENDGTKWIGTDKGLVSFNDSEWIVYDTSNSSIVSDNVLTLAIDGKNTKWIGHNGDYRMSVFNENGIPSSVNENYYGNINICLFPNPITDLLNIETNNMDKIGFIRILNIQGQIIKSELINEYSKVINLNGIPNGLYILQITNEHGETFKKFVKR